MIPAPRKLLVTLLIGLALVAGSAQAAGWAQGYSRAAQRVIARGRTAAGGTGWNYLRGWHETGLQDGTPYDLWLDPLRYGMRLETHAAQGLSVQGFNGSGAWRIAPSGAATGSGDPALVAKARTEAFFDVYGFFYAGRLDARGRTVGVRQSGGRSFDVVEVQPWGGAARELWFDRRSGLLTRMVDRSAGRPVTTELSDYRRIGPVQVAFRYAVDGPGGGVRQVQTLIFTPADRAQFSLPRDPAPGPSTAPG